MTATGSTSSLWNCFSLNHPHSGSAILQMSRSSANLSQGAFIFHPDNVFAVDTFEPSNGEMPLSHVLKMLDKRVVHGSAA
jgi:hypothetical protein